jgi:hypothetical protein
MWPVPVVVIDEDLKNPLKVLLVQDQQPIENTPNGLCARTARQPHSLVARETGYKRLQCCRFGRRRQNAR